KDIGFILSMDDFGTGYSSLNLLRELPMDILKIDRTFFNDEFSNVREKTIMKDIVSMAHHLNMRVVSEGVETQRQRELLMDINCDMEQGYLYSRPVPMQQFLEFIATNQ
ncbi:MAG: EAL domain-containing protein, partial [Oscillospiraceae bacterium]